MKPRKKKLRELHKFNSEIKNRTELPPPFAYLLPVPGLGLQRYFDHTSTILRPYFNHYI
ncbi:MAG: hypothetical protein J6031_05975 [Bacteroidales bacterium]|nr:hypothetical protein [Bacteroidales bacterium]